MASPFTPQPKAKEPPTANTPIRSRVVAAGAGARWWTEGWRMFRLRVGTWVAILIVYIVVSLLVNEVPHIGAIADWILTPVFFGGIMLGCDALHKEEPLRLSHLFDGFKGPYFVPLLLVGVFNLVLCLLAIVIGGIVLAAGLGMSGLMNFANLPTDPWQMWRTLGLTYFLLVVVALIVFAVIAMANWFAPTLIVLREAKALEAMMASFRASLRNWLPFLVYGMIGIAIAIATMAVFAALAGVFGFAAIMALLDGDGNWGTFTLGTAFLGAVYAAIAAVIAAVIFGSTYASYRDTLAADDSTPEISA